MAACEMVGRGNDHRVQRLLLLQHLAEVLVELGVGILLARAGGRVLVHVAQGDDVFAGATVGVAGPFAATAHDADVQLVIGRKAARL